MTDEQGMRPGALIGSRGKRIDRGLTRSSFREMMARVCPADAAADDEMKRLLDRLGGPGDGGEAQ